ncbi:hypothetical protein ACTOB_006135 [Actinoplanes oblitus]|uniref:Uncharacterized protein n=1 Tax=Actinoplanes oblitus TaxID=3040509 RepID=A0ABY8W8D5_9ACTN|nr:hypothetical protein [Actinoplanes oblitus]WIM94134.1 hypothetical protein ACTOB_006135 [Actinoplanes oblitus]
MKTWTGLLLLVASVVLVVPALFGLTVLMSATSLVTFSSMFAAFVLVVSSASIAIFAQLGVLTLIQREPVGFGGPVVPTPAPSSGGRRALRTVPFLLAALALLPGCTSAPAAQAATPAACGSASPDQVVATAALEDGKAVPAPRRVSVPLGSQVRLGVSVDVAARIHVHGYDLEYPVRPGEPMCIVFVAARAGLFDVEAHPDTLLLQLEVK